MSCWSSITSCFTGLITQIKLRLNKDDENKKNDHISRDNATLGPDNSMPTTQELDQATAHELSLTTVSFDIPHDIRVVPTHLAPNNTPGTTSPSQRTNIPSIITPDAPLPIIVINSSDVPATTQTISNIEIPPPNHHQHNSTNTYLTSNYPSESTSASSTTTIDYEDEDWLDLGVISHIGDSSI